MVQDSSKCNFKMSVSVVALQNCCPSDTISAREQCLIINLLLKHPKELVPQGLPIYLAEEMWRNDGIHLLDGPALLLCLCPIFAASDGSSGFGILLLNALAKENEDDGCGSLLMACNHNKAKSLCEHCQVTMTCNLQIKNT